MRLLAVIFSALVALAVFFTKDPELVFHMVKDYSFDYVLMEKESIL